MAVLPPNEMFYQNFEPVQKNRFIVLMDDIPQNLIKKIKLPEFTSKEVELWHINILRKVKGKSMWGDVELELYNPIAPNGSQLLMEWVRLGHESVTGRDGYNDFYKKDLTFQVLSPVGEIVSEWVFKGAFIKSSNFGEYDYEGEGLVNLQLTLSIDYAVLNF
jgi:hypothetical protein